VWPRSICYDLTEGIEIETSEIMYLEKDSAFLTTHKVAWCIILVLYVCQMITFESLDAGSSYMHMQHIFPQTTGQVHIWRSSGQGQGHRSQKCRKFLFPQCTTSIGNNSHSVKQKDEMFACSMGFSGTADRIVWPPSLLHERKWPCVTMQVVPPQIRRQSCCTIGPVKIVRRIRGKIITSTNDLK